MHFDLETTIAQRLQTSREAISPVLRVVVERIRQQVAHYGYARVSGLGTFRGGNGDITFEPDPLFSESVNLHFTGLHDVVLPAAFRPEDDDLTDTDALEASASRERVDDDPSLSEDEDVEADLPPFTGVEAPPETTEDAWRSTSYTPEEESRADFEGIEDPLDETAQPEHGWTEAIRESDTGAASPESEEVTEGPTAGPKAYSWDEGVEEPPEISESEGTPGEYRWDDEEEEDAADLDDGTEMPSVTWTPIDERAEYDTFRDDVESTRATDSPIADEAGSGTETDDDLDEIHPGGAGEEADYEEPVFDAADSGEDSGYDAAYYEAGTEPTSESQEHAGIEGEADYDGAAEYDDEAGQDDDARYDDRAAYEVEGEHPDEYDYEQGAEYTDDSESGLTTDVEEEAHADRSAAAGAAAGLAPDRHSRPHEWHRHQSRAKRAAAGSVGEGAGGSQRTVVWIGVGLIIVAAAAIAFFVMSPFDVQEPVVSERQEPEALLDTSEATGAATDTSAGETIPETPSADATDPSPAAWDPLRSSEGFDFDRDGYAIVVRSETSRARAEEAAEEFRDQGFRTGVLEQQDNGATRLRVGVGQFATVEEAVAARDSLAGVLPGDAWVLRVQ